MTGGKDPALGRRIIGMFMRDTFLAALPFVVLLGAAASPASAGERQGSLSVSAIVVSSCAASTTGATACSTGAAPSAAAVQRVSSGSLASTAPSGSSAGKVVYLTVTY